MSTTTTSPPVSLLRSAAAAAVLVLLGACSTLPADNAALEEARSNYTAARNNPRTTAGAPQEMKAAEDALKMASDAWTRRDSVAEVNHLAYLAKQRVAIAQETGRQKTAEAAVAGATMNRDKMRLEARTNEADSAQRSAEISQQRAAASQKQSEMSQQDAAAAQRQSEAAQQSAANSQRQSEAATRAAMASQQQSAASQQQASDAETRARQLEMQLKELNAKKTERGLVITLGDVLFDTNKSDLKSGAQRSVDRLVGFLKQYPQRKAMIEGFTDNVGSESSNQMLSGRRAEAVRTALLSSGVAADRLAAKGYGESFPVAGNESSGGRQANRRVEIILSDDSGNITAR
jgi:outer membrane protein OmpA-like peptidoglycan-associated protein